MAAKGGGGLYLSHVVPKKQWASQPPLTLRLVGYRKSLSFMLLCMIWRRQNMESKKISNGQEFIQPDSILLPKKEKKFTRHTRYIRDAYIKISHHLGRQGKQKVTGGLGGGGLGERSGELGAWCRGRWLGGLNYFAAKKGFDCHASV